MRSMGTHAACLASPPKRWQDALAALESDHEFLLRGDVFSRSFIDTWVETKQTTEVWPMAIRPHPYEYVLYLDA